MIPALLSERDNYTEYNVFVNLSLPSELEKGLQDEALLSLANLSEASWSSPRFTKTYIYPTCISDNVVAKTSYTFKLTNEGNT